MSVIDSCALPTAGMFGKAVRLHMGGVELSFEKARKGAYDRSRAYSSDPMLISWFDRKGGAYSPSGVEWCGRGEPSWLSYAHAQDSDLAIDINEEFIFLFKGKEGLS